MHGWLRPTMLVAAVALASQTGCGAAAPAATGDRGALQLDAAPAGETFALAPVADGFVRPTHVSGAPGDDALWVAEQPGTLMRLAGGVRQRVIDLRDEVSLGAERGLLGVAFHPGFARNRRVFVNYTDRRGDTRVVEFCVDRRGRSRREREVLHVAQPEENHNGGGMAFGPDGRLYVGMGDGGGAWDPRDLAQDPASRLGKLLAADVDARGAPAWEAVLSGLRNPWRFWFDAAMDELWLGDVGQDEVEELDRLQLEADEPAKNLGWPAFEGDRPAEGRALRGRGERVDPVATYTHESGCSVTVGVIYRGTAVRRLGERFILGDFCTGTLWTVRPGPGGRLRDPRREAARAPQLTHIGTDAQGELVLATGDGRILRAVAR